ncbi:Hypothetical protein, predicted lipoprotein [Mycoplasmopsis bovigenitalium 51080]|uniref:Lipoprotein n=1 Tax=Mycoplasmopsis bovigenitalium 51080 TaxID=1188235 RepID=N9VD67_9BACT|nr:hypothetical protein [Mycoplasmopsis bovigenitalium]ENY69613.1 Hypothetical protein, predicted lipoprotein [Mycoplasmopsis bovigenitalium 51080]
MKKRIILTASLTTCTLPLVAMSCDKQIKKETDKPTPAPQSDDAKTKKISALEAINKDLEAKIKLLESLNDKLLAENNEIKAHPEKWTKLKELTALWTKNKIDTQSTLEGIEDIARKTKYQEQYNKIVDTIDKASTPPTVEIYNQQLTKLKEIVEEISTHPYKRQYEEILKWAKTEGELIKEEQLKQITDKVDLKQPQTMKQGIESIQSLIRNLKLDGAVFKFEPPKWVKLPTAEEIKKLQDTARGQFDQIIKDLKLQFPSHADDIEKQIKALGNNPKNSDYVKLAQDLINKYRTISQGSGAAS